MSAKSLNQAAPPRPRFLDGGLNINTVLLAVVVALSTWTVNRVQNLSEQMAANSVQVTTQNRDIETMRARMMVNEAKIEANALAIARMQNNRP